LTDADAHAARLRLMAKKAMHNTLINAKNTAPTAIPAFAPVDMVGLGVGVDVPLLEDVVVLVDDEIRSVDCHRIDTPYALIPSPGPEAAACRESVPNMGET
jgi:hypothetical protein